MIQLICFGFCTCFFCLKAVHFEASTLYFLKLTAWFSTLIEEWILSALVINNTNFVAVCFLHHSSNCGIRFICQKTTNKRQDEKKNLRKCATHWSELCIGFVRERISARFALTCGTFVDLLLLLCTFKAVKRMTINNDWAEINGVTIDYSRKVQTPHNSNVWIQQLAEMSLSIYPCLRMSVCVCVWW